MTAPLVVVHRDATLLAQAVAARIVIAVVDAQAARGSASIVLTGGGIGGATLRELAANPARDAIDWSALDIWWGDERFLPTGHEERNETQARAALLDLVPIDPSRIHAFPASDGPAGDDLDAAAALYAAELAQVAEATEQGPTPTFDVLMLGVGPEGHVASLFPDSPALQDARAVIPVRGCPKPPPIRLSMSFATINAAREVWLVAAGEEKATAARLALTGATSTDVPAAGVAGQSATRWLLDRAAAAGLPAALSRVASP